MNGLRWLAIAGLSLLCVSGAAAQNYPTRPVTIVVPYAAGGGTDLLARMVAQKLEQRLGKSFVVENRPGGGTVIAAPGPSAADRGSASGAPRTSRWSRRVT